MLGKVTDKTVRGVRGGGDILAEWAEKDGGRKSLKTMMIFGFGVCGNQWGEVIPCEGVVCGRL